MSRQQVEIESETATLAGEWATPTSEGTFPAALILGGSGPLDRDGNVKRMPLSISRDIAELLLDNGWASLRFDKRGVGESSGDYMTTGMYEELEDARSAYRWLSEQQDVGDIVVIGHSMGASQAVELAASEESVAGVIMLAGMAKTGEETLSWQTRQMQDTLVPQPILRLMKLFGTNVVKQQAKSVSKIKATTTDAARVGLAKINAKWMREMLAYDPIPSLADTDVPVLAITGTKDVQVDHSDLAVISDTTPNATVLEVPDVDHLLREETDEISNPRHYRKQIQKPIDSRVTSAMVDWLNEI